MKNKKPYTVSHYILDRLKELGVRHFFAVPGDYASIFLETLVADKEMQLVPNINELGVGYAADGYGRFKGAAACSVQYGVGAFSILNCLAGSLVERVPVALIGPTLSTASMQTEKTKQVLFHHSTGNLQADYKAMKNATVAAVQITDGGTAPEKIDAALTAMITFSRPVYIEVRQEVFGEACKRTAGRLQRKKPQGSPSSIQAAVNAAWEKIAAAKLPVLWLGTEIQRFGLQQLAQELVTAHNFYFTTTSLGKTVLDESHDNFIGTYAGPASPAYTRQLMADTDCPVALGAIVTDDYLDIIKDKYGQMIHVLGDTARVGKKRYRNVPLKALMEGLLQKMRAAGYMAPGYPVKPANVTNDSVTGRQPLTYELFYNAMAKWLVEQGNIKDSVLVLGESTSLYVFGNMMGLPANSFVAQAAWGSLGHETGCALGIELATGKRPVVVAGDGGFMMVCQELSSLARQGSSAIIFVMSNGVYAIEQAFVDIKAFSPEGSFAPFDLLPEWDYPALAKAFGADGYIAATVEELVILLAKLENPAGKPSLVQIKLALKDLPPQLRRLAEPGAPVHASRYAGKK